MPVFLRGMEDGDEGFIYSSWLHSFRYCVPNIWIKKGEYFKTFHKRVEDLLKSPKIFVLIAVPKAEKDVIVGYVVCGVRKVYWVYVKEDFRKLGIATLLLKASDRGNSRTYPFSNIRLNEEGQFFDNAKVLKKRFNLEFSPHA